MKNYETILFDLDGTLTDPGEGITNSVAYALNKFGIETPDKTQLYKFIGPPLIQSFREYFSFSEKDAAHAVKFYREYFKDKGIFENKVYDGIIPMLNVLSHTKKLIIATSKPEIFAKRIADKFQLTGYFDFIAGSELDGTRINKDEVIKYALSSCNIPVSDKIIMAGDRKYDISGAKKTGIASIGVLYGYGTHEELLSAGADYIAETVKKLETLLISD